MIVVSSLVERLAQQLKQDRGYRLDPNLKGRPLLQVLHQRGTGFVRGTWRQLFVRGSGGSLFVGAHVTIRHPQMVIVGRSVILEDYVFIDALSEEGVALGDNVTIGRHATIQCTGVIRSLGVGLRIGSNSAVGAYSFLGTQGGIRIGRDVIMGPRVSFHAENHMFGNTSTPIRLQGESRSGIVVDDDCWIGAGAIILDGVRIGKGCVVGAGSVVTRDLPAFSIAAGVPARVVDQREASSEMTGE